MDDLEKYVAEDGEYIIPVTWEVYSNIVITGVKNLKKEAYEVAKLHIDELPLTEDSDYIDGSYQLEEEEFLLDAQNYAKRGAYFKILKAED